MPGPRKNPAQPDLPGAAQPVHVQAAVQHQACADGIARRGRVTDIPDDGGPAAQLVGGHRPAGFGQQRVMLLDRRVGNHPVHIHPGANRQALLGVVADLGGAVQSFDIHQVAIFVETISHAYKNISAAQERARRSRMIGQKTAGFEQGGRPDIVKFG